MKKSLFLILNLQFVIFNFCTAQAPQGINYQGVARSANGNAIPNKAISLRLSILNGSSSGTLVYSETQAAATGIGGLFNVTIGGGTPVTGTFSAIDWSTGVSKWVKVEMDTTGGTNYLLIGSQQLMSVPYALYAANSGIASNGGFSNMQVFSSPGSSNFTVPAGVTKIMVEVWGGGGGGATAGNPYPSSPGGGGGGGGYGKGIFSVTPNTFYTVIVGAGGAGGYSNANGGISSFGNIISATGGIAGSVSGSGGAGGTSTAPFNITGAAGSVSLGSYFGSGGNAGQGGQGGQGVYVNAAYGVTANGNAPGGGGNGGQAGVQYSGAGANGEVVVWW